MAGRSRSKAGNMEHFTLFLPASLLAELRAEVEENGGTVSDKIRFYIESGRHWREKYAQAISSMVVKDAFNELIEHDPGLAERQAARLRQSPSNNNGLLPKPDRIPERIIVGPNPNPDSVVPPPRKTALKKGKYSRSSKG